MNLKLDIRFSLGFSSTLVEGNSLEMTQAVMNLLSNASDAGRESDEAWIEVILEKDQERVHL